MTLSYSVEAAVNMTVKLSVDREGPAVWLIVDIGRAGESLEEQVVDEGTVEG